MSTRKVVDLVKALWIDGISKSELSRRCKVLDQEFEAFRSRPIEDECPYVILDATFHKSESSTGSCRSRAWPRSGSQPKESGGSWAGPRAQ